MGRILTGIYYMVSKVHYSLKLSLLKKYKGGYIAENFHPGKLTYLHWDKGDAMAPTIAATGGTLLVRKLPEPTSVLVNAGDVVVMKNPEKSENFLVRRLAAIEGDEMVSKDGKEEPFVLEEDHCWVLADNKNLKPMEANDSRKFGPVPMSDIVGRVVYCMRTRVDHGPVQNSYESMKLDSLSWKLNWMLMRWQKVTKHRSLLYTPGDKRWERFDKDYVLEVVN